MAQTPKKGARSDDPGLAPRALALDMIEGVQDEQMTMAEMLVHDHVLSHPPAVRARAQRLALATLRQMARADAALKPFMQRRPHAEIRALLRLAVTEILGEGAAPHGVVNTAVALAKKRRPSASGMVNAVLRKITEDEGRAAWSAAQPQRLPNWLRGPAPPPRLRGRRPRRRRRERRQRRRGRRRWRRRWRRGPRGRRRSEAAASRSPAA